MSSEDENQEEIQEAEAKAETSEAPKEKEMIAICTECKSMIPDRMIERDVHYRNGNKVSCRFCGGVVAIVDRSKIGNAMKQADRQRGL